MRPLRRQRSMSATKDLLIVCSNMKMPMGHLQNLKNILESGTPVIRNKQAGHGQGTEVVEPSNEFTDYAIHLAATNILFLVNLYKENL